MKKRILLTGSAGRVGSAFRKFAHDLYDIVCFDRNPTPDVPDAVVGNLTDLQALTQAAQGCQAMVHLGAHPSSRGDFMTTVYPSNIIGMYNACEAARLAGVKRLVFSSTVQVDFGYPRGAYVSPDARPRPANMYAVSKVYGEHMGRVYAHRHGLSVICLRFGAVMTSRGFEYRLWQRKPPPDIAVTIRDVTEMIRHAVDVEGVDYAVLPAFSLNAAKIRDLSFLTKVIGYTPQEDAIEMWNQRV